MGLHVSMSALCLVFISAQAASAQAAASSAAAKEIAVQWPTAHDLTRLLQQPIDMKDYQAPMTLKEALGLFYDTFQTHRGIELPILVDQQAFKADNPKAPGLYEAQIKFPPYPRHMKLVTALKLALSQVPGEEATFLIRDGYIEITTMRELSFEKRKQHLVIGRFEREPVLSVIVGVADQAGISVAVDSRLEEKVNIPVTLTLRNGITVHDALRILTDMAGLKLVELPTSFYVTSRSPAAEELQKSVRPSAK